MSGEVAARHRWWHLSSHVLPDGEFVVHACRRCGSELGRVHKDDPYRCPICDSRFCDEGNHH